MIKGIMQATLAIFVSLCGKACIPHGLTKTSKLVYIIPFIIATRKRRFVKFSPNHFSYFSHWQKPWENGHFLAQSPKKSGGLFSTITEIRCLFSTILKSSKATNTLIKHSHKFEWTIKGVLYKFVLSYLCQIWPANGIWLCRQYLWHCVTYNVWLG